MVGCTYFIFEKVFFWYTLLYTHMPVMRRLVDTLQAWNFRICGIFVLDCHFMVDGNKFISGAMAALSVMVNLELPHVNVLSKVTKML